MHEKLTNYVTNYNNDQIIKSLRVNQSQNNLLIYIFFFMPASQYKV